MHKIATINNRIEPKLKTRAETILRKVGLTSAEAVRLFYMQVCLNKETIKAMRDANKRKTHQVKSVDKLFEDLG